MIHTVTAAATRRGLQGIERCYGGPSLAQDSRRDNHHESTASTIGILARQQPALAIQVASRGRVNVEHDKTFDFAR